MGGKGGKVQAPDYGPVAAANKEAAEVSAAVAREQLAWAKEQYAADRGVSDQIVAQFMDTMKSESDAAAATRDRYEKVFQPVEDRMVREAAEYDTPARRELEASRASAEVAASMDGQRRAALAALEGFGVDPSMARSAALDAGVRVAQGAAQAAAANQGRLTAEATGRALTGEVVNLGRGYPGQVAQAYGTAQGAGQGAVGSQLGTTASGASTMGTGAQWQGLSNSALGNWGNQVTSQINNANTVNAQRSNFFGQALGAVTGALMGPMGGLGGSVAGGLFNMGRKALMA